MAANPTRYVHVTDNGEVTARIAKCLAELHETVIVTREVIRQSRDYLRQADRMLAGGSPNRGKKGD